MGEELSLDNILDEEGLSLFNNIGNEDSEEEEPSDDETAEKPTVEIDPEHMFGESESVDSEEDNEEKEDAGTSKSNSSSPKADFFSSIAEALAAEGILPDLDEDDIKEIKTPEDLRKAIDDYIKSELDEQQQRVVNALNAGVEDNEIRQFEAVIRDLNAFKEDTSRLEEESDDMENFRKRLIYQDYINRGFSDSRARKEVEKSIKNGTDIEDAKEALEGNLQHFTALYNSSIEQAKEVQRSKQQANAKQNEQIAKTILDEKTTFFGDLAPDKKTRQKAVDAISKPIYKDPETGAYLTEIQKYESEHTEDFLVKLGILYTLTDGFKSLDGLVNKKVKKEVKKGLRSLEDKLNNSSRDSYGNLTFTSGVSDSESYIGKGLRLAL